MSDILIELHLNLCIGESNTTWQVESFDPDTEDEPPFLCPHSVLVWIPKDNLDSCVTCFSCKGLSCEGFPWLCSHTYVLSDQPWIDSYQWSTFQAPFLQFSNIVRVMFWLGQFVPLPQNAFMCLSMKHIPSSIRAIQQYCPRNVLAGPACPTAPIPSRQNVLNCCVRDLENFLSAHISGDCSESASVHLGVMFWLGQLVPLPQNTHMP